MTFDGTTPIEHDILPIRLLTFTCEPELLNETMVLTTQLLWTANEHNSRSVANLSNHADFQQLHQWFERCVDLLRGAFDLPFQRLRITQSWANRTDKGEAHHRHRHPNSYLSGLLYLTTHDDADTIFYRTNEWFNFFLTSPHRSVHGETRHRERSVAGKLLLFPSSLEHSVAAHAGTSTRMTISFNAFPEGNFGGDEGNLASLSLKVLPPGSIDDTTLHRR